VNLVEDDDVNQAKKENVVNLLDDSNLLQESESGKEPKLSLMAANKPTVSRHSKDAIYNDNATSDSELDELDENVDKQKSFAATVSLAQNHDEFENADFSIAPAQLEIENVIASSSWYYENQHQPYKVSIAGINHSYNAYTFCSPETSNIGSVDSQSNSQGRRASYICNCHKCDDSLLLYGYLIKHLEVKIFNKSKRTMISRTYLRHLQDKSSNRNFFLLDIVMTLCTVRCTFLLHRFVLILVILM
jgi:hypothetical protein